MQLIATAHMVEYLAFPGSAIVLAFLNNAHVCLYKTLVLQYHLLGHELLPMNNQCLGDIEYTDIIELQTICS